MSRALHWVIALATLAGCADGPAPPSGGAGGANFDHPEGVAIAGPWVVVTNTAYRGATGEFGEGSITVVDAAARAAVHRIPTSRPNPQYVVATDTHLFAVCSGQTRFDLDLGLNHLVGEGAIVRFPLDTLLAAEEAEATLVFPFDAADPTGGAPGSIALVPGTPYAYVASGLSARVYKVDLSAMAFVRGPDDPIVVREHELNDTLTVTFHAASATVLVTSFDTNALYRLDPTTDALLGAPVDLGLSADLEGPVDVAVLPGADPDVFALMSLSSSVAAWTAGEPSASPGLFTTGAVPNRITAHDGWLYVTNSGANNLQRIHPAGGTSELPFAVLPVASNPYELAVAVDAGGPRGYVSLFLADAVAVIDLASGELLEVIE
jgi:hypothetical protein